MKRLTKSAALVLSLLLFAGEAFSAEEQLGELVVADTASTTPLGHAITLPEGWSVSRADHKMIVEAPEGESRIVVVDVEAEDAESAISAAWAAYKEPGWKIMKIDEMPDWNGFTQRQRNFYQTSPNEQRSVIVNAGFSGDSWNVWIYDIANDVGEKFGAQISLVLGSLKAKGWSKESFAGKKAHQLNEEKIAQLTEFIDQAMELTGVPGVGFGLVQDGKVIYAGGLGVRELGKPEKVDANTLFMVASNTKSMATMLLAKQVDQGKLTWKTPVTDLLPTFRLGNDETTKKTLVEHLICACTGLPRKDMPWIFEFAELTADDSFRELAAVQPTTDFGERFQYSNNLAAAAGFIGGHVAYPDLEIGAAFDKAMQVEVFDPLGMASTTFDFKSAMSGNYSSAHSTSIEGKPVLVPMDFNYSVIHLRPAGGAWSDVDDMLKYIQLEIDEGVLPDGKRLISSEALLERRLSKVSTGSDSHYGMGLSMNDSWGVPVVHHGGDMLGHHSDMMWLPEHGVGAIVLTNGDPGWLIRGVFQRRLLEVLFDGEQRALSDLKAASERYYTDLETLKGLNDESNNKGAVERLASSYRHDELGRIGIIRNESRLVFDTGELKLEVTTKTNPDGSISFSATEPGWIGMEFVLNDDNSLTLRDSQHEYVFNAE
jgi:CubicO group peptidase (beta-lactamase class C family)